MQGKVLSSSASLHLCEKNFPLCINHKQLIWLQMKLTKTKTYNSKIKIFSINEPVQSTLRTWVIIIYFVPLRQNDGTMSILVLLSKLWKSVGIYIQYSWYFKNFLNSGPVLEVTCVDGPSVCLSQGWIKQQKYSSFFQFF